MNLYFVAAQGEEMNLDWFIVAEKPQQAVSIWKDIDVVLDFTEDDRGDHRTKVEIMVFHVGKDMEGPARSIDWHKEIPMVFTGEV